MPRTNTAVCDRPIPQVNFVCVTVGFSYITACNLHLCCVRTQQGTKKTEEISAGYLIRRSAVDFGVSLITNVKCASLLVDSLVRRASKPKGPYIPVCIEEYYGAAKVAAP